MNETSLVAVDRKYGPVVNLENVAEVYIHHGMPDEGVVAVTVRYVGEWKSEYAGPQAKRIINALNARFGLELEE